MKILGLDLGVGSIGWSLIEVDDQYQLIKIIDMGVRIVPLAEKQEMNFLQGRGESINAQRTFRRTTRKGYKRRRMRRKLLVKILTDAGMYDPEATLDDLSPLELWKLRAEAVERKLSLREIGRVLRHLAQKRGYKHSKNSTDSESKDRDFVGAINTRYRELLEEGITIGQKLYSIIKNSIRESKNGKIFVSGRVNEGTDPYTESHLYPRQAHIDEFNKIMEEQSKYYPELLTSKMIGRLNHAIFFQRPLKSCKDLVSDCEFVEYWVHKDDGTLTTYHPKVAPISSPLSQETRIWETVNNIRLENRTNKPRKASGTSAPTKNSTEIESQEWRLLQREYVLTMEEKHRVVNYLRTNERLSSANLLKLLGLKGQGFTPNIPKNGLKGDITYVEIAEVLNDYPQYHHLLEFKLKEENSADKLKVNKETGEIIPEISEACYNQPLYKLWHLLYSVTERNDVEKALRQNFGIKEPELIDRLYALDFKTAGFGNRSAKFMREILPFLMQGMVYSDAVAAIGKRHSDYLTSEENEARILKTHLIPLQSGALRQPTVEKVLNQMILVVNDLVKRYGSIDEVCIEMARELRQSKAQREETNKNIGLREKDNERITKALKQYGAKLSRNNIQKYRLWEEAAHRCVYCGEMINITEFLNGEIGEKEHIIPRSQFFDDSLNNKVLACKRCNGQKGARTGYDFMESQGEKALEGYMERVRQMYENPDKKLRISKTKYNRLLTPGNEIPADFLNRDLGETQYITRKAMELLKEICRKVVPSTGKITDFFRHHWGYDMILHDLNLPRYEEAGLVEDVEFTHNDQTHTESRIKDWTKRMDHRHHAIDALTVALTRQKYIHRLNRLNSEHGFLKDDIELFGGKFKKNKSLLTEWAKACPHFGVNEVSNAISEIAISTKPIDKIFSLGKKQTRKDGSESRAFVPKGQLHNETIYGKIRVPMENKQSLKYCLAHPDMIQDKGIREAVKHILEAHSGNTKDALKWVKKHPLKVTKQGEPVEEFACWEEKLTIRTAVNSLKRDNIAKVIDRPLLKQLEERSKEFTDDKAFQASFKERPIYHPAMPGVPVKYVTCYARWTPDKVIAARKVNGKTIGYAAPDNNHHVAFYRSPDGKIEEQVISMWIAVKRAKLGLPGVITNPKEAWDMVINRSEDVDSEVVNTLPQEGSMFLGSIHKNEMFVLGLSEDEWNDAISQGYNKVLSDHLYRVKIITTGDYTLSLHTYAPSPKSTKLENKQNMLRCSIKKWISLNPHKVAVSPSGQITPIFD